MPVNNRFLKKLPTKRMPSALCRTALEGIHYSDMLFALLPQYRCPPGGKVQRSISELAAEEDCLPACRQWDIHILYKIVQQEQQFFPILFPQAGLHAGRGL